MSKKKGDSTDYQIKFISKFGHSHENFARMHRSMYESERYRKLSASAKDIYIGILLACNKGNKCRCVFPKSAYEKITTKATFHKAKKELIENGFITEITCRTNYCIYTLSEDWKLDVIPKREPIIVSDREYRQILKGVKNWTKEDSD